MRTNIVHIGASELNYEIRQIAEVATRIKLNFGKDIVWENIGDPIEKGEKIPGWMKEIMVEAVNNDKTYAYSPTRGLLDTREFLAKLVNARGGATITSEDIIFFNGLGDAVSKLYNYLRREARVIGPSPAYSTHSSAEAAHSGYPPITYRLDPHNGWMPDMEELRNKVKYNESIAGIMIINPDNPTGAVFPREVLEKMVDIAREFDLFIVADEIYMNMVYNGKRHTPLSDIIGSVPGISLKGISKEFPWPGGRSGWMEVYNQNSSQMFRKYVKSILDAKMLEVSSTTLPQYVIPKIFSHPGYEKWLADRNAFYEKRSQMLEEIFSNVPGVILNKPDGAFYASIIFDTPLNEKMHLKIEDPAIRDLIEANLGDNPQPDRKFVYQLLGAKNICIVPLSSFVCNLQGFRITTLERDDEKFLHTMKTIGEAIREFIGST